MRYETQDPRLIAYRRRFIDRVRTLRAFDLPGLLDPGYLDDRTFDLKALYYPLTITDAAEALRHFEHEQEGERSAFARFEEPDEAQRSRLMPTEGDAAPRTLLISGAGGGKSMLARRIALAYLEDEAADRTFLAEQGLPEGPYFPVMIVCREFSDVPLLRLEHALRATAEKGLGDREPETVDALVESFRALKGQLLLIVDGMDELSDLSRRYIFDELHRFVEETGCALLVTTRISGLDGVPEDLWGRGFTYRTLCRLDEASLIRFTRHWFSVIYDASAEQMARVTTQVETLLTRFPYTRDMLDTPLMAVNLLNLTSTGFDIPTHRSRLFSSILRLLFTWRQPYQLCEKIYRDSMTLWSYVAYAMSVVGKLTVDEAKLFSIMRTCIGTFPFFCEQETDDASLRDRVITMVANLGLLDTDAAEGGPTYRFRHRQYQEFLTAYAVTEGIVPDNVHDLTPAQRLEPFLTNFQWLEVITFALFLLEDRDELLTRLITSGDSRLTLMTLESRLPLTSAQLGRVCEVFRYDLTDDQLNILTDYVLNTTAPAAYQSLLRLLDSKFAEASSRNGVRFGRVAGFVHLVAAVHGGQDPEAEAEKLLDDPDTLQQALGMHMLGMLGRCRSHSALRVPGLSMLPELGEAVIEKLCALRSSPYFDPIVFSSLRQGALLGGNGALNTCFDQQTFDLIVDRLADAEGREFDELVDSLGCWPFTPAMQGLDRRRVPERLRRKIHRRSAMRLMNPLMLAFFVTDALFTGSVALETAQAFIQRADPKACATSPMQWQHFEADVQHWQKLEETVAQIRSQLAKGRTDETSGCLAVLDALHAWGVSLEGFPVSALRLLADMMVTGEVYWRAMPAWAPLQDAVLAECVRRRDVHGLMLAMLQGQHEALAMMDTLDAERWREIVAHWQPLAEAADPMACRVLLVARRRGQLRFADSPVIALLAALVPDEG